MKKNDKRFTNYSDYGESSKERIDTIPVSNIIIDLINSIQNNYPYEHVECAYYKTELVGISCKGEYHNHRLLFERFKDEWVLNLEGLDKFKRLNIEDVIMIENVLSTLNYYANRLKKSKEAGDSND